MLNFDLEYNDWNRMNFKQNIEPVMQLTSCVVQNIRKKGDMDSQRLTDQIIDGIYFFGGKNQ